MSPPQTATPDKLFEESRVIRSWGLGHSGTAVTEAVYRKQIRPVIVDGATAIDRIFNDDYGR